MKELQQTNEVRGMFEHKRATNLIKRSTLSDVGEQTRMVNRKSRYVVVDDCSFPLAHLKVVNFLQQKPRKQHLNFPTKRRLSSSATIDS